jgi:hypothetical protein
VVPKGGGVGERDIDLLSQLVDHAREKVEKVALPCSSVKGPACMC